MADSRTALEVTAAALDRDLEGYTVLRQVGQGAMGMVFEAEQRGLGRRVALKVLPPQLALRERTVKRFLHEAQSMGRLAHPNVVDIYEVGSRRGYHYFAMKFAEGPSLDRVLDAGALPVEDVVAIGIDVAGALAHAHGRGVLHRDVKPGNLLRDGERVLLTDFGLARHTDSEDGSVTESGDLVGTPLYMAPEQISGEFGRIDARTDIWGLGATLYELVCDAPPFTGATPSAILHSILQREPARVRKLRPGVPRDLEAVLHRCLEKDPSQRYATAADLRDDLIAVREGRHVTARSPRFFDPALRWCRRHPLQAALAAGALAITLTLGGAFRWVWRQWNESKVDVSVAEQQAEDAAARQAQAEAARDRERRERTIAVAQRAIADARQLWTEGQAQSDRKKQLEASQRILDVLRTSALDELPEIRAEALELAATLARAQGEGEREVLAVLEPLFTALERGSALLYRAAVLSGLGRYEEALTLHGLRILERPTDARPLYDAARIERRLALAALDRGDLARAESALRGSVSRLGSCIDLAGESELSLAARVERARGQLDLCEAAAARAELEAVLAREPGYVDAQATLLAVERLEREPRRFGMNASPSSAPVTPPPAAQGQDAQLEPVLRALEQLFRGTSAPRRAPSDL
ncbi:MAG: serine/threonine protein kinase [Planctomycetes bacterium]|nr:serine/threonine protein kinase [Planctomycetota bacterium]